MSGKTVIRHDRDLVPISSSTDGDDNWKARIYRKAEARQREATQEERRHSLRDRIGVPRPPTTSRERILGVQPAEPEPDGFDVVRALREAREKRERREKVRHH